VRRIPWWIPLALLFLLLWTVVVNAKQTQPDPKRVKQIQAALVEHSYAPGRNWVETQATLRSIAATHGWQTHRAPDARVLILLGLGNKYSDPGVVNWGPNLLEDSSKDGCIGHCRQDHECQKRCAESEDGCPHWDDE